LTNKIYEIHAKPLSLLRTYPKNSSHPLYSLAINYKSLTLCQWLKDSGYKFKNIFYYGENKVRNIGFSKSLTDNHSKNLFSSIEERNCYIENVKWLESTIKSHLNNNNKKIIYSKIEKYVNLKIIQ
jgi:hypothetical protein